MWYAYEEGSSIGLAGVDGGITLKDEEMIGARITLEKDSILAPFSITCGVYGLMVHTVLAGSIAEALQKYDEIKKDIESFMDSDISEHETINWCEWFTKKF